jgi:hypothetical protein
LVVDMVARVGVVMLVEMVVLVVEVPDMMEHKVHIRLRVERVLLDKVTMVVLVEVLVETEELVVEAEVLVLQVETQPQIHLVMVEMENKYQLMELQPTTQVVVAVVIMVLPTEVKVVSVVVEM